MEGEAAVVSVHPINPTPHEDVNALLRFMLTRIQAILGSQLVGFYLYGSLSLGDFDPASSDVDFLIVTAEDLPAETLDLLREMHATIAASSFPYATRLEGSYIPCAALRRPDPAHSDHPTIGIDWEFQVRPHGSNWIFERYIVREHGVTVWGPSPRTLIDPISPDELRAAVCHTLDFWRAQLDSPAWLHPREYQAFAILTLCRVLYTLHHGALCSKPQAAAWARKAYPVWQSTIENALLWRSQHEKADMTEMLTFLRETLAEAEKFC
jgi:hypothetical protein